jgi:uncharacterized protein (TIGR00296 family)
MVDLQEGKLAIQLARQAIRTYLQQTSNPPLSLSHNFTTKSGVFVTLHTHPQNNLRGCIGIPYPIMSLKKAIQEAAVSVTHDPRFHPLKKEELQNITIEITILTPPILISVNNTQEYTKAIEIGRDGLIIEKGPFKGLLLPQVPIEQKWDVDEYLAHTCMKAGLSPDAWKDDDTKIYNFSGQIFYELSPNGEIEEKKIDGSHH